MNKILGLSAIALILGTATITQAAGFQLSEYSTTNLGRAFAGVGVVGDDFSAIGYNPAGMNFNQTSGASLGASTIGIRSHVKGTVSGYVNHASESGKTNPYIVRVLPNGFAQYKLNDRATAGIGIYTPFGLATDYDNDWFGRTHALRSEIQVFNVSPALSYKVTDELTFGGAVNLQYADATMTSVIEKNMGTNQNPFPAYVGGKSDLQGNDLSVGYTLGTTYEPIKGTRFGAAYRSKVTHKLEGKNKVSGLTGPNAALNGSSDIHAKITTPETITLSAWQKLTEAWSISATARWTRWTQFKNLDIYTSSDNKVLSATQENWQNTWFYALGADYQYCKNLIFRFGTAYDESAVKSPYNRTARIPDGQRVWATLGASYLYHNWQFDGGYAHLFVHDAKVLHGNAGSSDINAKYRSNANIFSLNAQYKF